MGGSGGGGGGYFPRRPRSAEVEKLVREAREQASRDRAEARTNERLLELLSGFNDRDVEGVRARVDDVEECLGPEMGVERLLFGGSVAKHTYVDGLSDVDALVVLEGPRDVTPGELRDRFEGQLQRRLPMGQVEEIRSGEMAVTLRYRDGIELQLLPAMRAGGDRVLIPSSSGEVWSRIDPAAFRSALTEVNQSQAGAVVPTIKLAKSAISRLPRDRQVSGYHVEALAVDAFRNYDGRRTPTAMLRHLIDHAAERVRTPITDVTGQSTFVDEYLGPKESGARKLAAASLRSLSRQLRAAASPDRWVELIAGR